MNKPWILLVFLLLSSCLNRPYYCRPDVDPPSDWRIPFGSPYETVNASWWEEFQDPVLNCLIFKAIKNNMDIKIAAARVYTFYARFGSIYSELFPQINGAVNADRERISLLNIPAGIPIARTSNNFELAFNASWQVDIWGRLRNAAAAAYHELLSQEEFKRGVILTLVQSLANAYIQLRQYDMQLEIANKTVESRNESYRLAVLRFQEGTTSELPVKQADSEVQSAIIQVKQLEILIPQQENLISVLLGENPGPILRGKAVDKLVLPPEVPAGIPSDILQQRPDVRQAEQEIYASSARVAEAKAAFYPEFSLTGLLGTASPELKTLLNSKAQEWQYGGQLFQIIFDAGNLQALLDQAKGFELETMFNYILKVQRAFQEVNDSLVAHEKSLELLEVQKKQVQVLGDYLELATLRYNEGETDYLNVLDAERSLFSAQLNLAEAYAFTFTSLIDLYASLGGGWVIAAEAEEVCGPLCPPS